MSLSDLIAFTALLIAVYGAILSTVVAIKEVFRLNFSIIDSEKTCVTLTKDDKYLNEHGELMYSYHKDLYTLIFLVRLENKSKNSTTINEIYLNDEYVINSSSTFDDFIPTKFICKSDTLYVCNSKNFNYEIIRPLIELPPLSTREGYLVFNNVKEIPKFFNIRINTVQKSKTFHIKTSITNDYRNEQI